MPELHTDDGATIHWESRGQGPLVVGAWACLSSPAVFAPLIDELVTEHRVVSYDPRGYGQSSPDGPFDPGRDAADLSALVEEIGEPCVIIGTGDGTPRAVRAGAANGDLVRGVVTPGGSPLGKAVAAGTEALAASASVIMLLVETMRADYRAGLRMAIGPANPQLDEAGVRQRIDEQAEYAPHEITLVRLQHWIDDAAAEEAEALGDRLWMLEHPHNPWFTIEVARLTRERLPEAHILEVPDGPLSRPDLIAGVVRRINAEQPAATTRPDASA